MLLRQPQRVGEGGKHLHGWSAVASLFEPCHILHADPGEGRHLGTTQPGGASARPGGQPRLGRGDRFTAYAQEQPSSLSLTIRT